MAGVKTRCMRWTVYPFRWKRGSSSRLSAPQGPGKSTLLHILGGVDRPTAGHVYINQQDVYAQDDNHLAVFRRREVGLIYQFYNLIPVLNVTENSLCRADGRAQRQRRAFKELLVTLRPAGAGESLAQSAFGRASSSGYPIGRALMNAARSRVSRRAHRQFRF